MKAEPPSAAPTGGAATGGATGGATGTDAGSVTQPAKSLDNLVFRQECLAWLVEGAGTDAANGIYWKTEKASKKRPYARYMKPITKLQDDGTATTDYMAIFRCLEGDPLWRLGSSSLAECSTDSRGQELYSLRAVGEAADGATAATASEEAASPSLDGNERGAWKAVKAADASGSSGSSSSSSKVPKMLCVQKVVKSAELRDLEKSLGQFDGMVTAYEASRKEAEAKFGKEITGAQAAVEVDLDRRINQ
eukprot:g4839.t1